MRPTRTESEVSLFKTDHSEKSRGATGMEMGQYPKRVTHPCELFYTESENDLAQGQQMLGAFKPPAPQSACAVYVRTRPQRGLAGVFALPRPAFDAIDSTMQGAAEAHPTSC